MEKYGTKRAQKKKKEPNIRNRRNSVYKTRFRLSLNSEKHSGLSDFRSRPAEIASNKSLINYLINNGTILIISLFDFQEKTIER